MFHEKLKKLRFLHGLTQAELADLLKTERNYPISPASISQLEKGVRNPSVELLYNLSKIFDCSVEYLLDIVPEDKKDYAAQQKDERNKIIGEITIYINSLTTQELKNFYEKYIPKQTEV